ncbi:hypothetical protein [Nonomuraea soli]|uniref:DUF5666 domain-containing protein n=1 Tax=Nonomuraea soli TaxID=1032476 RepID=A0A7W0CIC5_9ACTN|nr:hypothetical protein [Nonomuraea soli]MBA2891705.1 hypothetical protein [Nonomuraea soli]
MRKGRVALLAGAVALLAMTGLSGSAMADPAPGPAGTEGVIVCETGDGQKFEVKPGVPVTFQDGKGEVMVTRAAEAQPVPGGETVKGEIRLRDGGEAVPAKPLEEGESHAAAAGVAADGPTAHAVPAEPPVDKDGKPIVIDPDKAPEGALTIACRPA